MISVPRPHAPPSTGFHVLLVVAAMTVPLGASADEWHEDTQPLFHIERSLNANIIQYDAVLKDEGSLDPDQPIIGYWIRKAEDGRRKKLSYMERKLAYGFQTHELDDGSVLLRMTVKIRRTLKVVRIDGQWVATTRIDGVSAVLDRVFVQLADNKKVPKVAYLELYGRDLQSGVEVKERIVPHQ